VSFFGFWSRANQGRPFREKILLIDIGIDIERFASFFDTRSDSKYRDLRDGGEPL